MTDGTSRGEPNRRGLGPRMTRTKLLKAGAAGVAGVAAGSALVGEAGAREDGLRRRRCRCAS